MSRSLWHTILYLFRGKHQYISVRSISTQYQYHYQCNYQYGQRTQGALDVVHVLGYEKRYYHAWCEDNAQDTQHTTHTTHSTQDTRHTRHTRQTSPGVAEWLTVLHLRRAADAAASSAFVRKVHSRHFRLQGPPSSCQHSTTKKRELY